MNFIRQPTDTTCAQACLAMVTGTDIKQAVAILPDAGETEYSELWTAFGRAGVSVELMDPPNHEWMKGQVCVVLIVSKDDKRRHWVVIANGKAYDPARGVFRLPTKDHRYERIERLFVVGRSKP